ncbi:MAG TPA: hypothetical protein VJ959_04470 [Desulfotignum sp.]|nr:hypothetical protein [Desulfotignum sp.]
MNTYTEISDYISELISKGYSSLAREAGSGNLKTFKEIHHGIDFLRNHTQVRSQDVIKCMVVIRLLVNLRENIIQSEDVPDSQIPNIYKSVDILNELLIKSAYQSIRDESQESITRQCEAFFQLADEIRKDNKLKGLGILDGKMKNAIGRLRKKASIGSIFQDKANEKYDEIVSRADEISRGDDLQQMGEKRKELSKIIETLENRAIYRNRLIAYQRRYETYFIKKISGRVNRLYKKSLNATVYDCQEILDILSSMEQLIVYHENKGVNISILNRKKKIQQERIAPVATALTKMRDYILDNYQRPFWKDYEALYIQTHDEGEVFSETFYEYTLKGFSPDEMVSFLLEKIQKLKQVGLKELKYISLEQEFIANLLQLIQTIRSLPFYSTKNQRKNSVGR